jgi:hypothetical protein
MVVVVIDGGGGGEGGGGCGESGGSEVVMMMMMHTCVSTRVRVKATKMTTTTADDCGNGGFRHGG